MDWLMGLPLTAQGFDQVQVDVDYLWGKVYAVPRRSTDTAADATKHILDMALRSGDGIPTFWLCTTIPSSRATWSENLRDASAPVFSLVQRSTVTRIRTQRWNESMAF